MREEASIMGAEMWTGLPVKPCITVPACSAVSQHFQLGWQQADCILLCCDQGRADASVLVSSY